ncbi:GNAT family acetyltransferase [Purpureocillium lavendulum]|uniref:GNAT family acetyltransferase n=1 Tax=Purpureocillium lavendulum TaxID=1247861 RepID=A0AB34FE67_9HYPO|nr:GNAT family acetyltransferase [Purpureocillium lavendulum]
MAIATRVATAADQDAISRIHYAALGAYHEFYAAFFKMHPRELVPEATARAMADPKFTFLVAEEQQETSEDRPEVVGFIRYNLVPEAAAATTAIGDDAAAEDAQGPAVGDAEADATAQPPSLFARKAHVEAIWERFSEREKEMDACYEAAAAGKRHFCEFMLPPAARGAPPGFLSPVPAPVSVPVATQDNAATQMTDWTWRSRQPSHGRPAHQRKGIGGTLLRAVTARADAEAVPTLLVASAEARGLYLRCGFAVLGEWTIDNEYWAGEVERHERALGVADARGLEQRFRGVKEVEAYMIRTPAGGDAGAEVASN